MRNEDKIRVLYPKLPFNIYINLFLGQILIASLDFFLGRAWKIFSVLFSLLNFMSMSMFHRLLAFVVVWIFLCYYMNEFHVII